MGNKRFDLWRVLRLAAILSLAAGYAAQWLLMISNPVDRTGTDFIHFYAAGQIAQRYGSSSVYNLDLQQKIEEEEVGFKLAPGQVLPFNHVPYLIPLLRLLMSGDYIASFGRWVLLLFIAYAAGSAWFIRSFFSRAWDLDHWSLLGGTVTFYPFFVSLLLGQDSAFLFLGAALWCVGVLKKNDLLAGLGLALTTVRPHICLALAIPFLFRDQKIWRWFFILALGLAAVSVLLLGPGGTKDFLDLLLLTAGGGWYGTHQSSMLNLLGLMLRLLPFVAENTLRLAAWIGYGLGIGLISFLWLRAKELNERLLGVSIILALFFSPHLHYHDLTVLIIPILLAVKSKLSQVPLSQLVMVLLGTSFVLFLSPAIPALYFTLPYILYAILIWIFRDRISGANNGLNVPTL